MGFSRKVSFVLLFSSVVLVNSLQRKRFVSSVIPNENRRSSRLSSVLTDYWSARGFHEASTDHLLASESKAKDLMVTGDEIEDLKGVPKVRIPRQRLTPPSYVRTMKTRVRRPRFRLTPATRKQDLEIMESVTLVDGGTQLPDGSIRVRPSLTKSQRKHQDVFGLDQTGPLAYHLQDDHVDSYKFQRQQPRQPSVFNTYSTLPLAYQQQQHPPTLGKPTAFQKAPKSIHQMSLSQFQKHLFESERPQQYEHPMNPPPTSQTPPPKEQQTIFVISQPPKPQLHQQRPSPQSLQQQQPQIPQQLRQNSQQQQPPPQNPQQQQPVRQNLQQQQQLAYSAQLFRNQFQHPFSPQTSEPSPLAKFTASLISTASTAAAAASAAAAVLSKSELASAYLPYQASPPAPSPSVSASPAANALSHSELAQPYLHFSPSPSPASPQSISASAAGLHPVSVPVPRIPHPYIPSGASHQLLPQILLPTTTLSPAPPTTLRPGVVVDDEETISQNQLIQPENLAQQLTMIYETGKKILYFPKGVVDTVDTFLKQMERNPMVAYWGDKFFAKVFGDTSGT